MISLSMDNRHPSRIAGYALIVGLLSASPLCAQVVYGTARISGTSDGATQGSMLGSAQTTVILVDSTGSLVAATTTSDRGTYQLHAPRAGSYRVLARRIGFVPDSSKRIALPAGATVMFNPSMRQVATALAQVKIEETQRCVIAPDAGQTAFRLWQEVQNALTGTLSNSSTRHSFTLARYDRVLDPRTKRVRASKTWNAVVHDAESYKSISADTLSANGFVTQDGKDLVYAAPDARTLTSDAFARTHCLRPVAGARGADSVGLAFEPVALDAHTDVRGTLWLTRSTSKLKYLEFQYVDSITHDQASTHTTQFPTSLEDDRSPEVIPAASGRIDYRELSDGSWIIDSWKIAAPLLRTREDRSVPLTGAFANASRLQPRSSTYVAALWEIGGDVAAMSDADGPTGVQTIAHGGAPYANSVSLLGVLTDSVTHQGVSGVTALVQTPDTHSVVARISTDALGHFTFDNLTPGMYVLRFESTHFDTLGVTIPPTAFSAVAGDEIRIAAVVPASQVAQACADSSGSAPTDKRIVYGLVRDAVTKTAIQGASVRISWLAPSKPDAFDDVALQSFEESVTTDNAGSYVICGLPRVRTLVITTTAPSHRLVDTKISSGGAPITPLNFDLPPQLTAPDSTHTPSPVQ